MTKLSLMLVIMLLAAGCSRQRDKQLFNAVETGDHSTLKALLQTRRDANARSEHWRVPLLFSAVTAGHTNSVVLVIAAGADLEAQGHGRTAILQAAHCKTLPCARLLLEAGASPIVVDDLGMSFIHHASMSAGHHDLKVIESLLRFAVEQGADINATDTQGLTALDWAHVHGHKDIWQLIKGMGGITGEQAREGRTPSDH